ncbi:nucleotidyltransferase family protein [Humidesulfovibrio idahonensis]
MRAILLAAGLGTRLAPLTNVLPKCLMPVNGVPLLAYWLQAMDEAGIADVLVNTHYLPDVVRGWLETTRWAGRVRMVHEAELLGTGGTLLANRGFVGDGPVMLVHADNLCSADMGAFAAAHANRTPGCAMTMMSFRTDSPKTCGILELDGQGVVRAFHEKVENPPGDLANAAVYIVEPEVVEFLACLRRGVVDFSTEVIPHYMGRIQTWENTGYHRDIGNVASLLAAQVEYPGPPPAAANLGEDVMRGLPEALAKASNLPLVPVDPKARGDLPLPAVLCARTPGDIDVSPGLARHLAQHGDGCILFFRTVPPGFSSASVRARYGTMSFAASVARQ